MTYINDLFKDTEKNQYLIDYYQKNKMITLHTTNRCNLGCPYCVNHKYHTKMYAPPSLVEHVGFQRYSQQLEKLLEGIDPQTLIVHFIGAGEVTVDNNFISLLQWTIEQGYKATVQTNLHGQFGINTIENACGYFTPKELQRITIVTSYHCGAYIDLFDGGRKMRDEYVYNWYTRLSKLGVKLGTIEVPMTSKCLYDPDLENEFKYMASLGGHPAPGALVGNYENKHYPESYTKEELDILDSYIDRWRGNDKNRELFIRKDKWNNTQLPHITHQIFLKNQLCYKRTHSIEILSNGRIRFCQAYPQWWYSNVNLMDLSNIKQEIPNLFEPDAVRCPMDGCGCDSIGINHCLSPHNIDTNLYYQAYYLDENKPEIAKLFNGDSS